MNDKQTAGEAEWAGAWADMQRHYWNAWSDLLQAAPGMGANKPSGASSAPWGQGFDLWSKMLGPVMPPESRTWMDKLMEINKGYLQMGEALFNTFSTAQKSGKDPSQWWESINLYLTKMQEQVASQFRSSKDPWAGFATLWGLPADTWKRLSSAWSAMPGDIERAFRDIDGLHQSGLAPLASDWLSTPTLGYTRESQEEAQRLGQLWLEYGQAVKAYGDALSRVITRAGELLKEKLMGQMNKGESLDSLRACYDLWVDCGEEAYAEVSLSDPFIQTQARMTNALMAVKRQEQKIVDEMLGALNMPTRRELDTSHRRLHQLQRQVWHLKRALEDFGTLELREEVAVLQRQVSELKASGTATPTQPTSPARRSTKSKDVT
jgi:class III poly(R)-hydroxyalkanoic acid synthase PhaE subunit